MLLHWEGFGLGFCVVFPLQRRNRWGKITGEEREKSKEGGEGEKIYTAWSCHAKSKRCSITDEIRLLSTQFTSSEELA